MHAHDSTGLWAASSRSPAPRPLASPSAGSSASFAAVYRENYGVVERYVRRRLGDPHLVEDIVAETFSVAFESFERYEERGLPVRAWLFRLATSRISRWLRKARPRPTGTLDPPARGEDERSPLARAALLSLPDRLQAPLALHYVEGLSVRDVAAVLGCREGTVKSRLSRGRAALRRRLLRMGWDA